MPAFPTIIVAGCLAIDFADILNTLYLSAISIFAAILLLEGITFVVLVLKTKDVRHPVTLAVMILFLCSLLLPALESPVAEVIKQNTSLNRVSAFLSKTYSSKDTFEFVITAHGSGSREALMLTTGYTNISINGNHYEGPSLHYRLKPELKISIKDRYETFDTPALVRAFDDNQMEQLTSDEHLASFKSIIETLAKVSSEADFAKRFGGDLVGELDLTPDENAVYRTIFVIIIIVSVIASGVLSKSYESRKLVKTALNPHHPSRL